MNHSFQTRLQRMLLALTLALAAGWALALPSPKDIEAAVGAGQLPQAEAMLREVLQTKPQSAKAHYELGQVLARQGEDMAMLGLALHRRHEAAEIMTTAVVYGAI